ncbi:hypothetical protein CHARACLAT_010344 [Characodon lateralis]|uniref:Uncharacterized protein n=1 Tax=Characodon lateralis TaxID=208331 RepID=A0ABU7DZB7_9TELE|nr:hypothetical protein [Characodon lateralis]
MAACRFTQRCFLSLSDDACCGLEARGSLLSRRVTEAALRTVCKPFERCLNTPQLLPPSHARQGAKQLQQTTPHGSPLQ